MNHRILSQAFARVLAALAVAVALLSCAGLQLGIAVQLESPLRLGAAVQEREDARLGIGAQAAYASEQGRTVVIAGSDFQGRSDDLSASNVSSILSAMKAAGLSDPDGLVFSGDFNYNMYIGASTSNASITRFKSTVLQVFPSIGDEMVLSAGNHESDMSGGINVSPYGPNDAENYGSFVIHEDNFPWSEDRSSSAEGIVKQTATDLADYLDMKVAEGYVKPVFVLCHVPLHLNSRCNNNEGKYSQYLVDVLNQGSDAGLNIVVLFGHCHDGSSENFHGANAVYYAPGDYMSMKTPSGAYTSVQVRFHYLNAGYTGYYTNMADDEALTMTTFDFTDSQMTITRYNRKGVTNLKNAGTGTNPAGVSLSNVYASPRTVEFNQDIDTSARIIGPNDPCATSHRWNAGTVTVEPTCTTPGECVYSCERNATHTRTEVLPAGHRYEDGFCTLCGVEKPPFDGYIDLTSPESAEHFAVINQKSTVIREGKGLYLTSTKDAVEPANGQLSGTAATVPVDLVKIEAEGDWTATVKVGFSQNGSAGYYEFFGFYATDGYGNMVGIRAGDKSIQDFIRKDGVITAETSGKKTSSGLKSASTHWFRIAKSGDSYECWWSVDGNVFAKVFSFEETGIEGDTIVLDAYSGMSTGYEYLVEYVDIDFVCQHSYSDVVMPVTCKNAGYTLRRCELCGASSRGGEVAALGHHFVGDRCAVCACMLGDVNGNGRISIVDAQMAYDMATKGAFADDEAYSAYKSAADVTGADGKPDGQIFAEDARAIQVMVHACAAA